MSQEVKFDEGRVERRYTRAWAASGIINMNQLPKLVGTLIDQRNEMVEYIEALHNKIDWILKKNECCDISDCLTARCTSDHK